MKSKTPRTDATVQCEPYRGALVDLARDLERDCAALRADNARAWSENEANRALVVAQSGTIEILRAALAAICAGATQAQTIAATALAKVAP